MKIRKVLCSEIEIKRTIEKPVQNLIYAKHPTIIPYLFLQCRKDQHMKKKKEKIRPIGPFM